MSKLSITSALKRAFTGRFAADDKWITVKPNGPDAVGTPVMLGEGGEIKAGMGGKFNGQKMSQIKPNKQKNYSNSSWMDDIDKRYMNHEKLNEYTGIPENQLSKEQKYERQLAYRDRIESTEKNNKNRAEKSAKKKDVVNKNNTFNPKKSKEDKYPEWYKKDLEIARSNSKYKTEDDVWRAYESGKQLYNYSGIHPDDLTDAQLLERQLSRKPDVSTKGKTPQTSWANVKIKQETI